MILVPTRVWHRLLKALFSEKNFRVFGLQGGTSSSKTYSIIQLLVIRAESDKNPTLTSIVSETIPHLKRGAIRDFFNIIGSDENDPRYNSTNMLYRFPNGSKIEFFSVDDPSKLRGARRDRLFINECNNIDKSAYDQLEPRTKGHIWLDWNPECAFWFHDKLLGQENVYFDISTYKDNQHLTKATIDSIESRRLTDPEWFRVYGEGQIGQYEGIVFKRLEKQDLSEVWGTIDRIYYGLDFGYYPDPAAFVISGLHRDTIYLFKEIIANDLDNEQLSGMIKPWCGDNIVWCDSAEPKSIKEMKKYGINARSVGGKDRQHSINWIKGKRIIIDTDCITAYNEMSKFKRKKDKNGNFLPVFDDSLDDHMIDALRYSLKLPLDESVIGKSQHIPGI